MKLTLYLFLLTFSCFAFSERTFPSFIPDLVQAISTKNVQLVSVFAPNCSMFPNITSSVDYLSFFGFVPYNLKNNMQERKIGDQLFILPDSVTPKLEKYLGLMNHMNTVFESAFNYIIPSSLTMRLVKRNKFTDPVIGTFDFETKEFLLNEDILAYFPEEPPTYLIEMYSLLEKDIQSNSIFEPRIENLEKMMANTFSMLLETYKADPALCFLCMVIGGTIIALVANIGAYLYSLRVCEYCGISDEACFYVSLYYLMLVYQNLPILAAILFWICSDVCLYAMSIF